MKKTIALLIVFSLVVAFLPGVSVEAVATSLTVEDILNDYHAKVFATRLAEEQGDAAAYSRGGSAVSLEQETVQILTDAGYEAYNVTSDNYDELEASLQTDFVEMGLDPDGSYIVVINGDNESEQNNGNSARGLILPPHQWEDENDSSTFGYTENGITYTMRYFTYTCNDNLDALYKSANFTMNTSINWTSNCLNFAGMMLSVATEYIDDVPVLSTLCSIASLLGDAYRAVTYDPVTTLNADDIVVWSSTAWTRSYIQVKNPTTGQWISTQCSSYAITCAELTGPYVYDPVSNAPKKIGDVEITQTTYSPFYNNAAERKARAVMGYTTNSKLSDGTGDISFYLVQNNNIVMINGGEPLFVHEECDSVLVD